MTTEDTIVDPPGQPPADPAEDSTDDRQRHQVPPVPDGAEPVPGTVVMVPDGVGDTVRKLAERATVAAQLRTLATNPDVVALGVERVRRAVDRMAWAGIALGLLFTMTNVQEFAAAGAERGSQEWWAAWLLDPMVSLVLIALLLAEQVAARWLVQVGGWVRVARWGALGATYAMNTWSAWFPAGGIGEAIPSRILLHSVPPLLVFMAAEAITDAREALTNAIYTAAGQAREPGAATVAPEAAQDDAAPGPHLVPSLFPELDELPSLTRGPLRREAKRLGVSQKGKPWEIVNRIRVAQGAAPLPAPGTSAEEAGDDAADDTATA